MCHVPTRQVHWTGLALLAFAVLSPQSTARPVDGEKAAAILESRCVACHHKGKARGGLDLTTREALLRGGDRGAAIITGNATSSLLYKLVARTAEPYMPHKQEKLASGDVARLADWIDGGAPYPRQLAPPPAALAKELWSLRPLKAIEPPAESSDWCRTPVDRFLLAAMRSKGRSPSPPADKRTLIRRATFDLTGLPPAPEEIDAFLKDETPDAWQHAVDRLLASPAYGERWARHWLDVARYADSDGFELDDDRLNAYQYRDFVIRAFNDDLPFDTFVRWSLAGDELDPEDMRARAATGFCTAGPVAVLTPVVGIGTPLEREKNRYDELDNIVSAVGEAFLGLSIGCARCHDHKFDPVSSREYYRLLAAFTTSKRVEKYLVPSEVEKKYSRDVQDLKDLREKSQHDLDVWLEARNAESRAVRVAALPISDDEKAHLLNGDAKDPVRASLIARFPNVLVVGADELRQRLSAEQAAKWDSLLAAVKAAQLRPDPPAPPKVLCLVDASGVPAKSYVLLRGDPTRKAEAVSLGFLAVLSTAPIERWTGKPRPAAATTYQRAALADWLTDCDAGAGRLLARVFVNRLWQHHFGEGLVRTPNDFGSQGAPPTHPELLDWLANDFSRSGWKVKPLQRCLLTSAAYMQSSAASLDRQSADSDNQLLSYRKPMRLEAEAIRDAILAVSGKLDRTMYGPAIKPVLPPELAETAPGVTAPRPKTDGPEQWRRGIYLFTKRSRPTPLLEVFDEPVPTESCGRRNHSTVASQALYLLNDQFIRDQARFFADRVRREGGDAPVTRVRRAYLLALGRPPADDELGASLAFLRRGEPEHMLTSFCHVLLTLNEFCYVD